MRLRVSTAGDARRRSGERGFTITELTIASAIFMLVVAGVVASNIFGLRMMELTEPKQQAARRAQELINTLTDDISTAWLVEVGTYGGVQFDPISRGTVKRGNALRVVPYADAAEDPETHIIYYKDPVSSELVRRVGTGVNETVVAWGITNDEVFSGEYLDVASGQWVPLDTNRNRMLIRIVLDFSELERTGTPVGTEFTYKSYQFETRLTWRAR